MTPEFAAELVAIRLTQTEQLLRWLKEQHPSPEAEALALALKHVQDASVMVAPMRPDPDQRNVDRP